MEREDKLYNMKGAAAKNAFAAYNGMELETVEPDHAIYRMEISENSKNPHGTVHGGALYALADNAAGGAAFSDGRVYVTLQGSLNFVSNQGEGVVRADARVRHRGRTLCVIDVSILGAGDKLLATGQFTFFCVEGGSAK